MRLDDMSIETSLFSTIKSPNILLEDGSIMIKQIHVVICDICGHTEKARPVTWRNETNYEAPADWRIAAGNSQVHLCPACAKKLEVNK